MVGQGVCCSVCDGANKTVLVCPACINNTLLFERRKMLMELSERRTSLLQRLNVLITRRHAHVDLEVRQQRLAAAAARELDRVRRAAAAVEEAKRQAVRLRASNAARRASLERFTSELMARRSEHLAHHPTLLRYQALTHSHVAAMLLAEQRSKLAVLLDTLPLRVAAIRPTPPAPKPTPAPPPPAQPQPQQPTSSVQPAVYPGPQASGPPYPAPQGSQGPSLLGEPAGMGVGPGSGGGGGSSHGGTGSSPMQITLCNLKLPDSASVSSLMVAQAESTSSALGYLLLLAELLSTYLGGPLLHEGSFQGSTSVVWQQHSFWNRRPSTSNARLPLFLEEGGGGGPGLSNPFPGLAAKVRGSSAWTSSPISQQQQQQRQQQQTTHHNNQQQQQQQSQNQLQQHHGSSLNPISPHPGGGGGAAAVAASAFSALTRAMSGSAAAMSGGGAGGGGGGGPGGGGTGASYVPQVDEALVRQRHTDLRLAYDMLLRSLACFTRDKVLPLGLHLPPSWGPLGWLAVLCASVRREAGTEAVLGAAQQALMAQQGQIPGELRVGTAGAPAVGGGDAGSGGAQDNDDDEAADVEEDGWDVVQAPFLPPPPSQPDEVEHWTRAMFTDANVAQLRGGGGGGGFGVGGGGGSAALAGSLSAMAGGRRPGLGGLAAALGGQGGPPAMSLERVRSIFSK